MQPVIARITRIASINPWPLVNPEALKYIVNSISMPFAFLSDSPAVGIYEERRGFCLSRLGSSD